MQNDENSRFHSDRRNVLGIMSDAENNYSPSSKQNNFIFIKRNYDFIVDWQMTYYPEGYYNPEIIYHSD